MQINIYCNDLHITLNADHQSAVSFSGEAKVINDEKYTSEGERGISAKSINTIDQRIMKAENLEYILEQIEKWANTDYSKDCNKDIPGYETFNAGYETAQKTVKDNIAFLRKSVEERERAEGK